MTAAAAAPDRAAIAGTEGYAAEAPALLRRYEGIDFEALHRQVAHLFPAPLAEVLDIGAGTARDAAAFAALGHRVTAVEPVAELRDGAAALHPSPAIRWLADSLPDLAALQDRRFDLVMLTAVWMHLDPEGRRRGMPRLAALLRPGGRLLLSLRHGPVPPGRRMFAVAPEEVRQTAEAAGLKLLLAETSPSLLPGKPDISWSRLGFERRP